MFAALHDFGTILRKVDVAVATFALVRKTSGSIDCRVSFSSIEDSSSSLSGSSVWVRNGSVFYIVQSVRPEPRTGLDYLLAVRPEAVFGRTSPKKSSAGRTAVDCSRLQSDPVPENHGLDGLLFDSPS
jgi:hypothetical protein